MTFTEFVKIAVKKIKKYYFEVRRETIKETLHSIKRDLTIGPENLIEWFSTIWCDRYWDSHYLFVVMRKKLSLMEHNIRKNGIHVDASLDADLIQICIDCLDRLIKDEYNDVAFKEHNEKWGELEWETKPSTERPDCHQMLFSRKNAVTEEQIEQELEESRKCWEFSDVLQKNDLATLFQVMEKEVLKWWD